MNIPGAPSPADLRSLTAEQLLERRAAEYAKAFPPEPGNSGVAFGSAPARPTMAEEQQSRVDSAARAWRQADAEAEDLPERLKGALFKRTSEQFGARPGSTPTETLVERLGTPAPERQSGPPLDVATAKLIALMTGRDPRGDGAA